MYLDQTGKGGSDLNSESLRGFSCLQDFNVLDEDIYECFERFTPGQSEGRNRVLVKLSVGNEDQTGTKLSLISGWVGGCLCFSWKLLTTILFQLRLELHGVSNP